MAGEIQFEHTTGKTCYVQVRNAVGQIWNTVGAAFEAYATGNVTDYDIAATEQGTASGFYVASMPAAVAGIYSITAKERAGVSPAESDVTVAVGTIEWTGTAISDTIASAGLNRAVKAIITGTVGAGSSTTSIVTSSMSPAISVNDQYNGMILKFAGDTLTAALRGQTTDITDSTSGGVLTVSALTVGPSSGDTFTIE